VLLPKEGLALINGTQAMTALLALAVLAARRLVQVADLVGALSTDALRGTDAAFAARVHALRPHPGQRASAANLWRLLQGSAIRESHRREDVRVQDPYSVRCMPQVHGAVRDLLADVERKLEIEMNSVTDNPLCLPGPGRGGAILSGGNFHGQPVALALDYLAMAVAEAGSISERRTYKLLDTSRSGLPPFLTRRAGTHSGLMVTQYTAAALVAENKILCHPASVDSIPTCADTEDHVSMGPIAARKAAAVVANVARVVAIELIAAAQALDFRRPLMSGLGVEKARAFVRAVVPPIDRDRELAPAIEAVADQVLQGAYAAIE
jgi:histidine ammonia-lyase